MPMQMQMNLLTPDVQAERLARNRGAERAADHADRVQPGWSDQAYEFLFQFVATHRKPFMTEDVRQAATLAGFAPPPDARAWGLVVTRAARANLIKRVGFGPRKSAGTHMGPTSIWVGA